MPQISTPSTLPTLSTRAPAARRSIPSLATALFTALALAACDTEDADEPADDAPAATVEDEEDATAEIVENLKKAGYPAGEITIDEDGVVLVGGDAVVSLGASREMIGLTRKGPEEEGVELRQYRTTNVIDTAIDTICINGSALSDDPTLSAGLDGAIANYNNQNLSFDMTRTTGDQTGCDVVIDTVLTGGDGGSAGLPTGGLPYRTVNIGSGLAAYGAAVATHVITHELGHCVGFRHTDYYNRSISCGWGGDEGQEGAGAHHIPNTPTTASFNGSVMNSCFNTGSTGKWDPEDIDALHQLYGRDCCVSGSGAGCGDVAVNECVGAVDSYCNSTQWDGICAGEVTGLGCGSCPAPVEHSCCEAGGAGCSDNVIEAAVCAAAGADGEGAVDPYCCDVAWDGLCVAGVNNLADDVALACGSTCCSPHGTAGCDSASVQACVGAVDPYCIIAAWDSICVAEVESLGCSRCP